MRPPTGTPPFSPIEIRFLLESLSADLLERPFLLTETGKRVRDKCREKGFSISRSDVSFVLKGILFGEHSFGQGNDDADSLGKKFVDSVMDLCRREQVLLDESQVGMLRTWVNQAAVGAR